MQQPEPTAPAKKKSRFGKWASALGRVKKLKRVEGTSMPLLVFLNGRSGGGMGNILKGRFEEWLGKEQVFDLGMVGRGGPTPEEALAPFVDTPHCRVLVCGGDGTCSWLLAAIDRVRCSAAGVLPVAVMPLGTGNDLSRSLGWGKKYASRMGKNGWLRRVGAAHPVQLDRWFVDVEACAGLPSHFAEVERDAAAAAAAAATPTSSPRPPSLSRGLSSFSAAALAAAKAGADGGGGSSSLRRGIVCNYLGFGIEAASLHAFHTAREAAPHLFNSPIKNQIKMVMHGVPKSGLCPLCCGASPQLAPLVTLSVRRVAGGAWEEVALPRRLKAILLLNISSHAAGRHAWGRHRSKGFELQLPSDGLIEVAGIASAAHFGAYLACGHGHLRAFGAIRLAQAAAVRVVLAEPVHMQADGEPWLQPAGVVNVSHAGVSTLLSAPNKQDLLRQAAVTWKRETISETAEPVPLEPI